MLKIYVGKRLRWDFWAKSNHKILFETEEDIIEFDLKYSKKIAPFAGGMLSTKDMLKLRDFIVNDILLRQQQADSDAGESRVEDKLS